MPPSTVTECELYINGSFTPPIEGGHYPVINPATEEQIGIAPNATPADMEAAVGAAHHAFATTRWSTDRQFRRTCMDQLATALLKTRDEYRSTFIDETGITQLLTTTGFYDEAIEDAAYWAAMAADYPYEAEHTANNIGGFTSGRTPWLPMVDPAERNVADQRDDPSSLLNYYRELIARRKQRGAHALE